MITNKLKLIKFTDSNNSDYLIIMNKSYKIKNKIYERGQCVKSINNITIHNLLQNEVDDILNTTNINKITIDKKVMTKNNIQLKRSKNGAIKNTNAIVLCDKDDEETINIIPINCFFRKICNVFWYQICSQLNLNNILNENKISNTLEFVYINNTETNEIENQINIRNENVFEEQNNINLKIFCSFSSLSPYLVKQFYINYPNETKLNPLDEQRVRVWLRELYPHFFNHQDLFDKYHEKDSLQLEEIRAVFRALIEEHIKQEWFSQDMFTPELGESLALLLRNQRDRMLLDYYQRYIIDYPFGMNANMSIWRQVFHHIAYDNQIIEADLWMLTVSEQLEESSSDIFEPTVVDLVIFHILNYFDDEPLMPVPCSTIYNTRDPSTYDTLRFDYEQRKYPMSTYLRNRHLPTRHILLSQSLSKQQCRSLPVLKENVYCFNSTLNPDKLAEQQRWIGPIFSISALYNTHGGTLKPFVSRYEVRQAICNIIYQEYLNNDLDIPYLEHENRFNDRENKCLLIALLDNTIIPSLYKGRALPLPVINDLKSFIDSHTKSNIEYGLQQERLCEQPIYNPLKLFKDLIENDAIFYIVTGAFNDDKSWWKSLQMFINNNDCPHHAKHVRDSFLKQETSLNAFVLANQKVISVLKKIRKYRIPSDLVENIEIDDIHSLRDLHQKLTAFFENYDNLPTQRIPNPFIRNAAYGDITILYNNAIKLSKWISLHEHDKNYLKNQRFLFDANIHDKGRRLGKSFTPSMNKPANKSNICFQDQSYWINNESNDEKNNNNDSIKQNDILAHNI